MNTRTLSLLTTAMLALIGLAIPPGAQAEVEPCHPFPGTMTQSTASSAPSLKGCFDLETCKATNSAVADFDNDRMSDQVEACFLGTAPLEIDTDGDGEPDGLDAQPLIADGEPTMNIDIAAIRQIHPEDACDTSGSWDPYFQLFALSLPTLGESIRASFLGWTRSDHTHDLGDYYAGSGLVGTKEAGSGVVSGNRISFGLDPDLTTWNGGLRGVDVVLNFGPTLVDHDHHVWGNDDYMPFDHPSVSVLDLSTDSEPFVSEIASDADTDDLPCQAQIDLQITYAGLLEQVLDSAAAYYQSPNEIIACSHPQLGNCVIDQSWG